MDPLLVGRQLRLRRIEDEDVPTLWTWRNSNDFLHLCSSRKTRIGIDEFTKELRNDFHRDRHTQYMIEELASGSMNATGTVYSYNFNRADSYVFVTIYLIPEYRRKGIGSEALFLFAKLLFEQVGVYKIYFEAYEYNNVSISTLRSANLHEEGRFKGQRFHCGKRWDVLRFAAYREDFERLSSLFLSYSRRHWSG